jgi:pSer/pThr/pTyr-binding forkhead associated (FHA) protein
MLAIAINALYTTSRRRGTTHQLSGAIVTCVIAALLLLPALVWYNMRFSTEQATISIPEVEVALVYVALFGWFLPLSVTASYCLFALPRASTTSVHIPRQQRTSHGSAATVLNPPRHQAGIPAPYVFREDTPWGWLEHRSGRFQGQRLALKRSIVTIGRGEDNEIWLDDDLASRNHAELACDRGRVYLTDCESLNGVLLNGRRLNGSSIVAPGDLLEIGSHRFLFELAEQPGSSNEQDDPLLRHVWHSDTALQDDGEKKPAVETPENAEDILSIDGAGRASEIDRQITDLLAPSEASEAEADDIEAQETAELYAVASSSQVAERGANERGPFPVMMRGVLRICSGESSGQSFLLDRPLMTIGRDAECDITISDASISRLHVQVLCQADAAYVQDLGSHNGTRVNEEPVHAPRRLSAGDIIGVGNIQLAYSPVLNSAADPSTPMPVSFTPPPPEMPMHGGPLPLRLPSKPKHM